MLKDGKKLLGNIKHQEAQEGQEVRMNLCGDEKR
jgi:hypothetical protein